MENRKEGGEDEEVEGDRRLVVAERGREEIGRGDRKRREGVGDEGDRRLVVAERGREEIGRGDKKRREGVGG